MAVDGVLGSVRCPRGLFGSVMLLLLVVVVMLER